MTKVAKTAVRFWVTIFAFFIFMPLPCAPAPAYASGAAEQPSRSEIQAAMNASVRQLHLQTELPGFVRNPVTGNSPDLPNVNNMNRILDMSTVATILFFASLIAIVAVIAMTWRDNLWSSSRARVLHNLRTSASGGDGSAISEFAAWEEKSRLEADELARRGNFAEAMHILLLRSVEELRRNLRISIAASLTSREILYHIALPSEGRPVLSDIISRVEVSYFGGHRPGADDYKACRDSFDALTDVLRQHSMAGNANGFITP